MQGRYFAILTLISAGELIIGLTTINRIKFQSKKCNLVCFNFSYVIRKFFMEYPFIYNPDYQHREPLFKSIHEREFNFLTDERGTHFNTTGLLSIKRISWPNIVDYPVHPPQQYRILCGGLGGKFNQYCKTLISLIHVGYLIHYYQESQQSKSKDWVIGHQIRKVPTDYGEFLLKNIDKLPDQKFKSTIIRFNVGNNR